MIRISTAAMLLLSLSACGSAPKNPATGPTSTNVSSLISNNQGVASLVAKDLVGVMSQIDVLVPAQTVLYASRPADQFGERMVAALQDAGYRLRLAQAEQEPRLSYDIQADLGQSNYTVIVTAGVIKVKRRYAINEAQQVVQPASSIFILGAGGDNIKLNDSIFANQQPSTLPIDNAGVAETQIALATPVPPKKEIIKQELVQQPMIQPQAVAEEKPVVNIALNSDQPARKVNMYQTRKSNFEELLNQFSTVRREIMIFPNDSLVMGAGNKQTAVEIVNKFRAESDVVSIIGCSHGKSAIDDGNQVLANGRANRVKDEFIAAGIQAELVLHEACWANVHFDELPRRGVVVTHKRML